ncbi:MAG: sigma-70 family RNA polymerase sigma factor [Bacteroidaceae bacterium]|nr:sigma-70 family RNA polymerase sigma factor [Bacteroidaceae bacterium]
MDKNTYISLAERFRHLAVTKASQLLQDEDEVEDVAQEVLLKMWERHDSLENDAKRLNAYVDPLTRNICLDRKKVKRRHPILRLQWRHDEEADSEVQIPSFDTPQRRMEEQEATDIYLKAMNRLPYHWKTIMQMRGEEEMSYAEIASILGTTESSARGTLSKAKKRLLELIKQEMR